MQKPTLISKQKKHYAGLDGLRGIAVLMVLWAHADNRGINPIKSIVDVTGSSIGIHGVFIFFVLSAFLLTKQFLLTDFSKTAFLPYVSQYMYRRFARIFPLYLLALTAYLLAGKMVGFALYVDSFPVLVKAAVLFDAPGFFWTIPVEFTYYLILPHVAMFLIASRNHQLFMNGIILFVLAMLALYVPRDYGHFFPFLCVFLLGSYAAHLDGLLPDSRKIAYLLDGVGLISAIILILLIPDLANKVLGLRLEMPEKSNLHFTVGVLAALITIAITNGWVMQKVFSSPLLTFWGKISFSAYLGHMAVLDVVGFFIPISAGIWIRFLTYIFLTALGGWISYRVFEMRIYQSSFLKKCWDSLLGFKQLSK